MKYTGPLFGKIGRRTIPLTMSSTDVDRLQANHDELLNACEKMDRLYGCLFDAVDGGGFVQAEKLPMYDEAFELIHAAIAKAKEGEE